MPKGKIHNYTDAQIQFISDHCTLVIGDLTEQFNARFGTEISKTAMHATRKRYGFKTGRSGCFEKGQKPWNTGMKGLVIGGRAAQTQFKKGSVPPNRKPLGHERICKKDNIVLVKVAEPNPYTDASTRYRPKHHVIWERVNGPIPKGMVLRFLDGDKRNFDLANLSLVTKSLNLRLNQTDFNSLPSEAKTTAKMICELEVAVFDRQKKGRPV